MNVRAWCVCEISRLEDSGELLLLVFEESLDLRCELLLIVFSSFGDRSPIHKVFVKHGHQLSEIYLSKAVHVLLLRVEKQAI